MAAIPAAADPSRRTPTVCQLRQEAPAADAVTVAYVAGLAFGVRLGPQLVLAPKPRAKLWISEEYRQLTEAGRREVARFVRTLHRAGQTRVVHRGRPASAATVNAEASVSARDRMQRMWKAARG